LLLDQRLQHVARFGNVGKINLGLDFVSAGRTRSLTRGGVRAGSMKMRAHLLRFVFFQGTGVGLLLRDTHFFQHIENGFAFDFKFPGQVVDSNLAHPPLLSSTLR
jgi:hypothetical protein